MRYHARWSSRVGWPTTWWTRVNSGRGAHGTVSTSRSRHTLGVTQVPREVPSWHHSSTLLWKKPKKRLEIASFAGVSISEKRGVFCTCKGAKVSGFSSNPHQVGTARAAPNGALLHGAIGISTAPTSPHRTPPCPEPGVAGAGDPSAATVLADLANRWIRASQADEHSTPDESAMLSWCPWTWAHTVPGCSPLPPSQRERALLLLLRHWQASWRSMRKWGPLP